MNETPHHRFISRSWWIGVIMLLSLIGTLYLVRRIDLSVVGQMSGWLLVVLLVTSVLYMLVNTLNTWVLLRGMGFPSPFGRLYLIITASLSTNFVAPVKAGIPVRIWLYKSMLRIPIVDGSASLVIETALGLFIGVMLALWGVQSALQQYDIRLYLLLLSALVASAAVAMVLRPQRLQKCSRFLPSRFANRITDVGERFLSSLHTVPRSTVAGMVFLYLIRIAARALCLHLILRDMNVSTSVIDLIFVQSIGGIVGIFSMLPMGIGAKDASLVVLMTRLGVPHSVAIVGALIDRALWTLVPLVAGIISVNFLGVNEWLGQRNDQLDGEKGVSSGAG